MTLSDPTASALPSLRGKHLPWLLFIAATVLLGATTIFGINNYAALPDPMPTHWDAAGEADVFAPKSAGTAFMPLIIGAVILAFLVFVSVVLSAVIPRGNELSTWKKVQRISMARATNMLMGIVALGLSVAVSSMVFAGWQAKNTGTVWPIVIGSSLLLPLTLVLYWMGSRWAKRRAAELGITPSAEETGDDSLWVAGFLYNNPEDPAIMVPQRSGLGSGTTINVGNPKGRIIATTFVVIMSAFPSIMLLLSS
ncbi:hypothetical protein CQ018_02370 [Arthrobacter sp. MYb227]|uniref:DUF1648 domain-containing protein n=1 Tax=Arthrobacter sp. MYb227 TaxID=1848601 RepID=UPI000CFCD293|nr:DUF1648 domain-containing protein [Arthrobacter sp. MYb227]PQZ96147.1 hypothetical protein CQ018_02370 [Arthrobacter sp. MYb227]